MADPTSTTYRAVAVTVKVGLTALLGIDLTVNGMSRVPKGGQVVAHNQVSLLDAFVVSLALAEHGGHRPVVMLRDDLRHIPVLGKLLSAGAVFVDDVELPREFDDDAFTAATKHLWDEHAVVVAPEHVISPSLEVLPLRSGAARLATATDVPLVPAAVFGAHRLFDQQGRFRPRRNLPVTVTFGNPVPLDGLFDYMPAMRRLQFDLEALVSQTLTDYPDREEGEQGAPWWPRALGGSAPSMLDTIDDPETMAPSVELWATDATVARSRRDSGVVDGPGTRDDGPIEPREWSLEDPPPPPPPPFFLDGPEPAVNVPIQSRPQAIVDTANRGPGASIPSPATASGPATAPSPATAPGPAIASPTAAPGPTIAPSPTAAQPAGRSVSDVIAIAAFDLPGQPKQVLRQAMMAVEGRTLTTSDATTSINMRVRDLHRDGARSVFWGILEHDHVIGSPGDGVAIPAGTNIMLAATRKVG